MTQKKNKDMLSKGGSTPLIPNPVLLVFVDGRFKTAAGLLQAAGFFIGAAECCCPLSDFPLLRFPFFGIRLWGF